MIKKDIQRLGLILALQAEIEGMKASNTERVNNGEALAYDESAFIEAAEGMRQIVYKHDDEI